MDEDTRRELALLVGEQAISLVEARQRIRSLTDALDAQSAATMRALDELSDLRATLAGDGRRRR